MPLNHVLRYRVQNVDEVQMTQQGSKPVKPLSDSDFEKEYYRWCKDPSTGARSGHCGQMQEHSSEWSEENAATYYFAVGAYPYREATSAPKAEDHAIRFFNDILLRSFPRAQPELQLESVGSYPTKSSEISAGAVIPAVWRPEMPSPRLLMTSAVVDCKVGGANFDVP